MLGAATIMAGLIWHIEASRTDERLHHEATKMSIDIERKREKVELIKLELQQRYHKESILQDQVRELEDFGAI